MGTAAMKYMMLVCYDAEKANADAASEAADTAATDEDDSFPWLDEVTASGQRLDGDMLRPSREASTVRVRDGEVMVTDGPFAETKEAIVGFDILECADMKEAIEVASRHPVAAMGSIEVRQFWH
jgi:hypothetical protein